MVKHLKDISFFLIAFLFCASCWAAGVVWPIPI